MVGAPLIYMVISYYPEFRMRAGLRSGLTGRVLIVITYHEGKASMTIRQGAFYLLRSVSSLSSFAHNYKNARIGVHAIYTVLRKFIVLVSVTNMVCFIYLST